MQLPSTKAALLLAAAPLFAPAPAAATATARADNDSGGFEFNCRPSQSCWPTDEEWNDFNQTVNGLLEATVPLGAVCFPNSKHFDPAACTNVTASYGEAFFRESFAGATEITQYEACGSQNCFPGLFGPRPETCALGNLPSLFVNVETPQDISRTLAFARQHKIRIVVKNTGHDYHGRSSGANTLGIRTWNMKNMSFEKSFSPKNCTAAGSFSNIGIMGAGVNADEAIAFFEKYGMMVTAGGCSSVGIAGGFAMGAGHGPLGPTYGLMVDQAVEFDVVTPDGLFRTINECNDPDLFWAMRGGGGGTYAVLVNYKFQLHPQNGPWATWLFQAEITDTGANGSPDVTKNEVLREIMSKSASEQPQLSKNLVSGYSVWLPNTVILLEILPVGEDPLNTLKNLTASVHDLVTNHPGLNITSNLYSLHEKEADFYTDEAPLLVPGGPVGINLVLPTRLITKENFESSLKVDALVDGILKGMEAARVAVGGDLGQSFLFASFKTTPANHPDPDGATSTNPVWRKTLWQFSSGGISLPGIPANVTAQINAAARAAMKEIAKPLAVQAAYANESDLEEEDWQNLFWGVNYDKLLAIKRKYDPDTMLNCWKCVGWVGPDDPIYSCYGDQPVPSVPFAPL